MIDETVDFDTLNKNDFDNQPSPFWPLKTNYNECDWKIAAGYFISDLYKVDAENQSVESLRIASLEHFSKKGMSKQFCQLINKAYFTKSDVYRLSPICLLLYTHTLPNEAKDGNVEEIDLGKRKNVVRASRRVATNLSNLLSFNKEIESDNLFNDFISNEICSLINTKPKKFDKSLKHEYLPFLSHYFNLDLFFLASNPSFLLENIALFLQLYTFLYISQLSLNISEWSSGMPSSKPLYFILENEKASQERMYLNNNGWKSFEDSIKKIFPILSLVQVLAVNKKDPEPLWSLYDKLDKYDNNQDIVQLLDHYAERFSTKLLNFVYDKKSSNIFEAITNLSDLYCKQFDKKYISSENKKGGVNGKIINSIIDNYTSGFRQTRRRGGTHLVINQDMLLFITNLIIGNNGKMRFNELIDNFNSRGIYFDSQSKSKLLDFFQRIGNIEKKSDSGDAVYVNSTI